MLPNRVHSGIERIQGLLGAQAVQQFCLMSVNINIDNIMLVSGDASDMSNVLVDYKDVFKAEGRLEEMLHLTFDKTVLPESGFLTTFGTRGADTVGPECHSVFHLRQKSFNNASTLPWEDFRALCLSTMTSLSLELEKPKQKPSQTMNSVS